MSFMLDRSIKTMIYSLTYTTDVKEGFAGTATAWFIKIRPEYKDDKGLEMHERVHISQFWRTFGFHGLLYTLFKSYRLKSEVEAYREQLCWPPALTDRAHCLGHYSEFIAEKYGLNITAGEALKLLS
jgi:hypothetical protein